MRRIIPLAFSLVASLSCVSDDNDSKCTVAESLQYQDGPLTL